MAISQEMARKMRNVALRYKYAEMRNPLDIKLPEVAPEDPKEWIVMEDGGAAVNGSFLRFSHGQKITDALEATLLIEAGLHLEATA